MIVVGIDPGTANTGYGVVEGVGPQLRVLDHGVITTGAGALERRLAQIHAHVGDLLDAYMPDAMAVAICHLNRAPLAAALARA